MRRSVLTQALAWVVVAASLISSLACAAQAVDTATSNQILARSRDAYGWGSDGAGPRPLQLEGRAKIRDIDLDFTAGVDNAGRFVSKFEGPARLVEAFDGEVAWRVDPSRGTETLVLGDRQRTLMTNWVIHGYWLSPEAPVEVTPTGDGERGLVAFNVRFKGTDVGGTARVEAKTGLLREFTIRVSGREQTVTFSDHRRHDGQVVAHQYDIDHQGEPFGLITVTDVKFPGTFEAEYFRPDAEYTKVARFDPAAPAALDVVALGRQRFVWVRVSDEAQGWFLFDTGASGTIVSTQFAKAAKAERIGNVESTGVGGQIDGTAVRLGSMTVGPLTLDDPVVLARDDVAGKSRPDGKPLSGLLGNDLLRHGVIEYDHRGARVALHDPSSYRLPRGQWAELMLIGGQPSMTLNYEGHSGWFGVDTGASIAVLFSPEVVERQGLLGGRQTRATSVSGSGGSVHVRSGELNWVEFAGRRREGVRAMFQTERRGSMADRLTEGLVGVGLFGDYTVIFDYTNGRIAFLDAGQ